MRIPTLQSNETFRNSLTIDEGIVFDEVRVKGHILKRELADKLNMSLELADKLYDRALAKFLKYATRTYT